MPRIAAAPEFFRGLAPASSTGFVGGTRKRWRLEVAAAIDHPGIAGAEEFRPQTPLQLRLDGRVGGAAGNVRHLVRVSGEIVELQAGPFTDRKPDFQGDRIREGFTRANRKLVSVSADGATGWSTPQFHDQLWEPICMASIVAHPSQPGTQLFSNPHTLARDAGGAEIPAKGGKRENLSIKLSRDDGKTWPVNKTLDAGPSAYSDLAVLPDGTVLCLYEKGSDIVAARFNLEWVTGGP